MQVTLVLFLLALLFLQPCWGAEETTSDTTEIDSDTSDTTEDDSDTTEDDSDTTEDDSDSEVERELQFELDGLKVEIQSSQEVGDVENEIEVEFELMTDDDELFRLRVEYEQEVDSSSMEVETEMEIEVRMFEIIEFMESGSTAGYQEDEDEVLQTYSAQAWDDLVDQSPTDAAFLQVTGSTSDGVLTVRLYVTPTFQTFDSFEIDPNTFKFDLVITNFPWTQDNSTLAIASRVETSLEVEIESDDDNDAVDVAVSNPDADVSAVFAWASTVQTSGPDGTISVIATTATSVEEDNLVYFTLDAAVHPEVFTWDPSVSVTDGQVTAINTSAASHFSVTPVLLLMIGLFNLFL